MSAIGHENVCRLDVAVHNALGVRGVERVGYLDANVQEPLQFERAALNHVLQGRAGEALHDHEEMAFVLTNFVDGTNIGMVQRRSRARFAAKPFQRLRIFRGFLRQETSIATKRPSAVSSAL